ncbi:uncharacterized protein [Periplaneta americana]|uniref:uncharacterized protein isoform X3 n=1 Tax=Periplaneta americana TaxID=6978 RepID=UPI0037E8789B
MDIIKMEAEVDPLAIQPYDDVVKEEENPSPDQAGTTKESKDSSSSFKWEVKIEESALPNTLSGIKCEPEEEAFGMVRVKQENKLEVVTDESEILPDRKQVYVIIYTPHLEGQVTKVKTGRRQRMKALTWTTPD